MNVTHDLGSPHLASPDFYIVYLARGKNPTSSFLMHPAICTCKGPILVDASCIMQPQYYCGVGREEPRSLRAAHAPRSYILLENFHWHSKTQMLKISTYLILFYCLAVSGFKPLMLCKHLLPTSSPEPLRLEIVEKSDQTLDLSEKWIGHSRRFISFFSTFCQLFFWLLACKSSRPVELQSK